MKVDDEITFIHNGDDKIFLKSKLFEVNMRMFKTSPKYRALILHCCSNIENNATTHFEDYKDPHGMSGANCAIPFNIIVIVRNRSKYNQWCQTMINPRILDSRGGNVETLSNCGSIRLKNKITVGRMSEVRVNFYDKEGVFHDQWFDRSIGSFTIQHEIEHNLGILITDK